MPGIVRHQRSQSRGHGSALVGISECFRNTRRFQARWNRVFSDDKGFFWFVNIMHGTSCHCVGAHGSGCRHSSSRHF